MHHKQKWALDDVVLYTEVTEFEDVEHVLAAPAEAEKDESQHIYKGRAVLLGDNLRYVLGNAPVRPEHRWWDRMSSSLAVRSPALLWAFSSGSGSAEGPHTSRRTWRSVAKGCSSHAVPQMGHSLRAPAMGNLSARSIITAPSSEGFVELCWPSPPELEMRMTAVHLLASRRASPRFGLQSLSQSSRGKSQSPESS